MAPWLLTRGLLTVVAVIYPCCEKGAKAPTLQRHGSNFLVSKHQILLVIRLQKQMETRFYSCWAFKPTSYQDLLVKSLGKHSISCLVWRRTIHLPLLESLQSHGCNSSDCSRQTLLERLGLLCHGLFGAPSSSVLPWQRRLQPAEQVCRLLLWAVLPQPLLRPRPRQ